MPFPRRRFECFTHGSHCDFFSLDLGGCWPGSPLPGNPQSPRSDVSPPPEPHRGARRAGCEANQCPELPLGCPRPGGWFAGDCPEIIHESRVSGSTPPEQPEEIIASCLGPIVVAAGGQPPAGPPWARILSSQPSRVPLLHPCGNRGTHHSPSWSEGTARVRTTVGCLHSGIRS